MNQYLIQLHIAFVVYKIKHNTFNDFGHHCLILQIVQALMNWEWECPHMAGASIHVVSLFHGLALTASEIEQKSDSWYKCWMQ